MSQTMTITISKRLGWLISGTLVGVLAVIMVGTPRTPVRAQVATLPAQITLRLPIEHTLQVTGTAFALVNPNVADLALVVRLQRDRAGDASVAADAAMQQIIGALAAQGVAVDDLQVNELPLVDPVYDFDTTPARLKAYEATTVLNVTIRDLTNVGPIIDAATDAGATTIGRLGFRWDPSTAEAQAREQALREQAMAKARSTADTLASAGGVRISGILTISEGISPTVGPVVSPTVGPVVYATGIAGEQQVQPDTSVLGGTKPVLGGSVELTLTVSVVYGIE